MTRSCFLAETVMHNDTVRVDDGFAVASGVLPRAACLERPPAASAARPHAHPGALGSGAASSSSPTCAATATAHCRTDRDAESIEQAAQMASWEDEGGAISS